MYGYDPMHPDNRYPAWRHRYVGGGPDAPVFEERLVRDPDDEQEQAPAADGWVADRIDVIEQLRAEAKAPKRSRRAERASEPLAVSTDA